MSTETKKPSRTDRMLSAIERTCRHLPPPAILFCILFAATAVITAIMHAAHVSVINPATGEVVEAGSLFTAEGLRWFSSGMLTNFTGFAPFGMVLAMSLAMGVCEESGLLRTLIQNSTKGISARPVPYVIAFIGVMSSIAGDSGTILLPGLAALAYISAGKHPVVGMIVGFSAAISGTSANLMVGALDSMLQGLTNQAIDGFLPNSPLHVNITCNWYVMMASTLLVTVVIGFISEKFIEPRFPKYTGGVTEMAEELTPVQKRALHMSGIAVLVYVVLLAVLFFTGVISGENGDLLTSPLLNNMVFYLFVLFILAGIVYGYAAKTFRNSRDLNDAMVRQMSALGSYTLFCFIAGQFQALFSWTKLGTILAVSGADFLQRIHLTGVPLWLLFIAICALTNLFMPSASAKWAIFAPVFVPMLMLMGYHPAFIQLLYRIGDSPINCCTPINPYLWMTLDAAQKRYMKDINIGTLVANMLPIAIALLIAWTLLGIAWALLGLPLGPGTGMLLPAGIL